MNKDRTVPNSGTNLTQGCSGYGLENARRYFIAQQFLEGANTALGHRWSVLAESSEVICGSRNPVQRENCIVSFARAMTEIIDLKLARPRRLLSRSQLLLAYSTNTFH